MGRNLAALFDPASVAIVGASNDPHKYGNWMGVQALRMRGRRPVYFVNRKGGQVLGRAAFTSLRAVHAQIELVVLAVPVESFEQAVIDALEVGARALVGITAGFAELGAAGAALQDRVVRRVRDAGAVLLGPNCMGLFDASSALSLTPNPMPAGSVSLFSQSGNVALEVSQFLEAHQLGFARVASLGNQADLGAADLIRDCIGHAGTHVIAVYCEDFRDGREFVAAAGAARRGGKPVVLLAVGGSDASARGARSHTGALTTSSAVIGAACRDAGIYRVSTPSELADVAALLLSGEPRRVRSVAVITDGGGDAGIASDVTEAAGLAVPEVAPATRTALRAVLPPSAGVRNPIDVAGAAERDIASFLRVLDIALADPGIDAVLMTGYFGGYGEYGETLQAQELEVAAQMARLARGSRKPFVVHTMRAASAAARLLAQHGVPIFARVEHAVRALAVVARTPEPRALPAAPARPGQPVARSDYWTARCLLADGGVPFPRAERVDSLAAALAAGDRIGFPVVLKALGLQHKSDAGGVALGLRDTKALRRAFTGMQALGAPGYTVEEMLDAGRATELIVGVRADPRFGPVVMVGMGGILAEVLGDVAFALAPIDAAAALALLESLRAVGVLRGVRGRPGIDFPAAAAAIVRIVNVALLHPELREIEVNPLLAGPAGAVGLDARIVPVAA